MTIISNALETQQFAKADQLGREALLERCADLAKKASILFELGKSLEGHGFAGSTRIPKTIFLATLTRMLPRPVSAVIKGPSSSGKSLALEAALRYVPKRAYEKFQGLSDRALVYSSDLDLRHRILVIGEAAGLAEGSGRTFLRQLLTEDVIRYRTVSQSKEGHAAKELIIQGPVGLLMTTTTNSLHYEDETRVLSLHTDQSPEQIERALEATMLTSQSQPTLEELAPWHALHDFVSLGDQRVRIPYDKQLIDRLPRQQRVLRDAQKIRALVTAHTLLHQCTRERDEDGALIAAMYDYYIVHDLIAEPLAQGLQASVPPHIREVVEAVALLNEEHKVPVGLSDVANLTGKDISSVSRNVQTAIRERYLEDQNPGRYSGLARTSWTWVRREIIATCVVKILREFKNQVYAEWPRGQRTCFADLPSHYVDVRAPGHEHAKSTGVAHGRCKGRTDRTTHGSLNNRRLNSKTLAKSSLHWRTAALCSTKGPPLSVRVRRQGSRLNRSMSPFGPKRTSNCRLPMSAFGVKQTSAGARSGARRR